MISVPRGTFGLRIAKSGLNMPISNGTFGHCTNVPKSGIFVPMSKVSERLTERRTAKRLSRPKLAEMVDLSEKTIINYESGEREPKTGDLAKLAQALDTTSAYLLGEINDPSPDALENAGREFRAKLNKVVPKEKFQALYEELESIRRKRELLQLEEREREIRRLLEQENDPSSNPEQESD